MTRSGKTVPPKGKAPPKFLNPARENGSPLTPQEVDAIRDTFAALRSERAVEKALGLARNTIRRYLRVGDLARGIRPLLENIPALPVQVPEAPPVLPAALHAPLPAGVPADDAPPAPDLPPASVPPPPVPTYAQQPVSAPSAPGPAAPAPVLPPAPQQPPQALPGVGVPLPAVSPAKPDTVASVQHTVNVANNELVRISRNTRALYDLRQRTLTRMVDGAAARVKAGEAPKLSRGEREMLMLLREARVRPVEMLALHRVEVGILGVTEGKGASDNIDPTDETKSIEDLQADLRGLLDERRNLLGDDPDLALTNRLPRPGSHDEG